MSIFIDIERKRGYNTPRHRDDGRCAPSQRLAAVGDSPDGIHFASAIFRANASPASSWRDHISVPGSRPLRSLLFYGAGRFRQKYTVDIGGKRRYSSNRSISPQSAGVSGRATNLGSASFLLTSEVMIDILESKEFPCISLMTRWSAAVVGNSSLTFLPPQDTLKAGMDMLSLKTMLGA